MNDASQVAEQMSAEERQETAIRILAEIEILLRLVEDGADVASIRDRLQAARDEAMIWASGSRSSTP